MIFLNSLLKCIKLWLKLAETNLESVMFNSLSGLKLKRKKKKGGKKIGLRGPITPSWIGVQTDGLSANIEASWTDARSRSNQWPRARTVAER